MLFDVVQISWQRSRLEVDDLLDHRVSTHADDPPLRVDARLNGGHRHHAAVEYRRQRAIDVLLGEPAEALRRLLRQRERNRRAVELVDRGLRVAQIVAGNRRNVGDHVVDRRVFPVRASGKHFQVRGQRIPKRGERGLASWKRPPLDERQPQLRRRLDDLLRTIDVRDPWKLHQDLIVSAVAGHHRFGNAQSIHPPFDGLTRLLHGVAAQPRLRVRPHPERHRAVARAAREHLLGRGNRHSEFGIVANALDDKLLRIDRFCPGERDAVLHQYRSDALDGGLCFQPQRIVGIDAEDEVQSSLQIEPELNLLRRGEHRPHRQQHHSHDDEDTFRTHLRPPVRHEDTRLVRAARERRIRSGEEFAADAAR